MEFGHALREARIAKGLTQEQLAERLHVTQPSVSAWEYGRQLPAVPLLYLLARELDLDPGHVLQLAAGEELPAAGEAVVA